MILESVSVGSMMVNCYILASGKGKGAIIIDPGAEARKITQALKRFSLIPAFIINTHGHFDHIGCDDKFGVPVYIHSKEERFLKDSELNLSQMFALPYKVGVPIRTVEDGSIIELDDISLKVLHLPGHSPGGIGLLLNKPRDGIVFTGDTLFCQGVGRTDLSGSDEEALINSIKNKLFALPDNTVVYPGHGIPSTIGEEKKNNLFLA